MAVLKCKMCGGELAIAPGITIAECEYCGSRQTLPRVSDERLASFYERANDLRMSHEFDKAVEIYEKIIEENPTDADAYWSMLLCQYGIDYVEETAGGERKPTINRAQLVSMFENVNYRSAMKYADVEQQLIYEAEAKRIDRILQRYLEISRNEPAYDVFICYKETDENGQRTIDSVRAGEIYRELNAEGFKVFFAPVTLENKLGEDYEPYIFAAIHSAKVMVVIGTKAEYMNAVWVKNEWSRFLTLAKDDPKKTLIPVYSGMDPYDMPEAFRFKQSQNMEKLGFMLDLVRGIEKLVGKNAAPKTSAVTERHQTSANTANINTLLQRAAIFLEDGDWSSANIYCEKVLDIVPTNGQAYLYKLLAEARVGHERDLASCVTPLDQMRAYKNAVRYADEENTHKLIGYNQKIRERIEQEESERREAERVRKARADRIDTYNHNKRSVLHTIDATNAHISAQEERMTQVQYLLLNSSNTAKSQNKIKRGIVINSILVLINCLIIYITMEENLDIGAYFYLAQIVLAIMLAAKRGKSKIFAFLLALFSVGLLPGISAIRGLIEASRISAKSLQNEKSQYLSEIQQLDSDIIASRKSLETMNEKLAALDAEAEELGI